MNGQKTPIAGSLNSLLVMEAAVRCSSFSVAARELNLSQPAVSRHITTLEERLGCALFIRDHNKIVPTEHGMRLADAVSLGFGHVTAVWRDILTTADFSNVVLASSYGFADQWLMPRFSRLQKAMGGAQVRVVTSDRMEDIDYSRLDAAVVWDLSRVPDRPMIPLVPDETFPVCNPEFLIKWQDRGLADPRTGFLDLSRLPPEFFLHVAVYSSGLSSWQSWFAKSGLSVPDFGQPPIYDAYRFMMRAALDGEGVALGWLGLIDEELAEGRLVRVGPSVSNREISYYLQHRHLTEEAVALRRLVRWFREEVEQVYGVK
ncbi:LysR family transcriptional regulator [Kiloniella sp. b19]|uniref:LysR family transcriptional regulator n=1 Tax=Kiloniella sp. GXU_MW_B19 TaxID=3141326 RepID=UPI0031E2E7C2